MISLKNTLKAISSKFTALNTLLNDVPHYTLLWTNPKPTSAFAAQTISLDLSKYDAVKIAYNAFGFKCDETYVGQSCRLSNIAYYGNGYMTGIYRNAEVSKTGVKFSEGYYVFSFQSYSVSNDRTVPYKIYGIKFGGGYNLKALLSLRWSLC